MLRNRKFQIDKLLITILLLISGILSAQENKNKFQIQYNPDIINAWWLEKTILVLTLQNLIFEQHGN